MPNQKLIIPTLFKLTTSLESDHNKLKKEDGEYDTPLINEQKRAMLIASVIKREMKLRSSTVD